MGPGSAKSPARKQNIAISLRNITTNVMPSTHKKEKPWDTDDIDKWKV
jgi:hypothetical protein